MSDRINYDDKVALNDRQEIDEINKHTAANDNEVKAVVNSHATEIEALQANQVDGILRFDTKALLDLETGVSTSKYEVTDDPTYPPDDPLSLNGQYKWNGSIFEKTELQTLSSSDVEGTNRTLDSDNGATRKLQRDLYGYNEKPLATESDIIREQYVDALGVETPLIGVNAGNTDFKDVTGLDYIYYTGTWAVGSIPICVFYDVSDVFVSAVYSADENKIDEKIPIPIGAAKVKANARLYDYPAYIGFQLNAISDADYANSVRKQLSEQIYSKTLEQETIDLVNYIVSKNGVVGDLNYINDSYKKIKELDLVSDGIQWFDINCGYFTSALYDLEIPNLFDITNSLVLNAGSVDIVNSSILNNKKTVRLLTGSQMSNSFPSTPKTLPFSRTAVGAGGATIKSKNGDLSSINLLAASSSYGIFSTGYSSYLTPLVVKSNPYINSAVFDTTHSEVVFNDNHIRLIPIIGQTVENVFVEHNTSTDPLIVQEFSALIDIEGNDIDKVKSINNFLNSYYDAYNDYRYKAPFKLENVDSISFVPDGGHMYYLEIHKASDFAGINTDGATYFATWSTDHNNADGGLYWGTFTSLDLSDWSYEGLFYDASGFPNSFSAETASMVYNPDDADGMPIYCYFQMALIGSPYEGQETFLIKTSGGRLHEATWTVVGSVFPTKEFGYDGHTGYQRVQRFSEGNWAAWGLSDGGSDGIGAFSASKDGIHWRPYKTVERTNGIAPQELAPDNYGLSAPFSSDLWMNNKHYYFGYAAPLGVSGIWDIDEVLGTFVVEMPELDEVVKIHKVSDLPKGGVLTDDDGFIHMYFFDIKSDTIIHQKSTQGNLVESSNGRGLRMPWDFRDLQINAKESYARFEDDRNLYDAAYSIGKNDIGKRLKMFDNNPVITIEPVFSDEYQIINILMKGTGELTFSYDTNLIVIQKRTDKQLVSASQYSKITLEYQATDGVGKQIVLVTGELKDV